ncbi:vanadium-dependent haloperoxidase [Salsuginibacillus kocurii]|uniref:vanadium-dependent haloperoxidase n=1 Tax=Salsuginibacillus kocurii TaxID=427078 RepID=UPI00037CAC17|nr:vanadium-dependent haloperoxidase [Salsuginibacillus kocurii]
MTDEYLRWSEVPYAGEKEPPTNPVTLDAGSWPLFFLKRGSDGSLLKPDGEKLQLPIVTPDRVDFLAELEVVQHSLKHLRSNQEEIAKYYGTGVPTKQWTPVIDRLIDTYGRSPVEAARILAVVQAAIQDTMVVVWDIKYKYDVARPNQYDRNMETVICTPRFPAYPSGHATMSGCSEVVLSYFFPPEAEKLYQIAEDNAVSRLFGGVHFPVDNDEGLRLGRYIGSLVVEELEIQNEYRSVPIDVAPREYRDADLFPYYYRQFIPFAFPRDCTSLVRDQKRRKQDVSASKPKLYL